MAPKRVLDVAEGLYQRGLLSYPRTETDQYDKDMDLVALLAKQTSDDAWGALASELVRSAQDGADTPSVSFQRPRNGSKNDKAHPPIHPTAHANGLSGDEKKVYDYITRRFLASCATDATGAETSVTVSLGGEKFHASGTMVMALNYLHLFTFESWKDKVIPAYTQGQRFVPDACTQKQGTTTRPALLTEADLVSLMDKHGIGTDATIAEHIRKIIDRQYVVLQKQGKTNYLLPSTLGMGLMEGYGSMELSKPLCQPQLRRDTEEKLTLVAQAALTRDATVDACMREYSQIFASVQAAFPTITTRVRSLMQAVGEQPQERSPRAASPPSRAAPSRGAPARTPATPRCECDLTGKRGTATQGENAGKSFWACPKESRRAQ